MGDEVRVTVIAAGFDRWDEGKEREQVRSGAGRDVFAPSGDDDDSDLDLGDDDFDVPSFLK